MISLLPQNFSCCEVTTTGSRLPAFPAAFLVLSASFGGRQLIDLSRLRFRRPGHAHEPAKPILEIEKLFHGHVQEAVESAQHLLRPLAERLAFGSEGNKDPPLVGRITLTRHQSLFFDSLEHRRGRAEIHPQGGGQIAAP
jgi:hypothetical protein